MKTTGNTILITGGATGIGFALAEILMNAGNTVLTCGRRADKLAEAAEQLPGLHTRVCDVANRKDREMLLAWVKTDFPATNILINNAGIQREVVFTKGAESLFKDESEIDINFTAPVHLSALFFPLLAQHDEAAIVNVSSGLGFVPLAFMPVYCATKAALHSFSISLRHQLRHTPVKVFEIIPPTVDTDLDKGARARRGQADRGITADIVATVTLKAMEDDQYETAAGQAQYLVAQSRANPGEIFAKLNP